MVAPGRSPSLAGRALLAVGLMAGFYLLAVGIAALLVWLPILDVRTTHHVHARVWLGCFLAAGVILWSVMPRWDRFPEPGVRLHETEQPELFAEIHKIAAAAGQRQPAEVYLVADVNAFVAQRGGCMGFFSRRVLGIGLPLLRVMTRDQVRGVLAHEFGHFHGSDTRLGPWIYKTRAAIGRTVTSLLRVGSIISYPFRWYGLLYLRITHAISRAQEFAADRFAATLVGSEPLIAGLRQLPAASLLFDLYWRDELAPLLAAGRRPPIAAGFQRFLRAKDMQAFGDQALEAAMQAKRADPYDTHPPIPARIAAVADLPRHAHSECGDGPALDLLRDVDRLEERLLGFGCGDPHAAAQLRRIEWEQAGEEVVIVQWREQILKVRQLPGTPLQGVTAGNLPQQAGRRAAIGRAYGGAELAQEHEEPCGEWVLAMALGVALHGLGHRVRAEPGEAVRFDVGAREIAPLPLVNRLFRGEIGAQEWSRTCAELGITDLALG